MGYYSNYLIKSIIRRIVNLLINRRTLKILLFVLIIGLVFFKVCNNSTFAYEYNDQTVSSTEFDVDIYNALFDNYNNRVNRALNILSSFTEEQQDDDLFFNPALELLGQSYSQYYIEISGNQFTFYIWDTRTQGASTNADYTAYDMDTFGNITSSIPCPFYKITINNGYIIYFNNTGITAISRFGVVDNTPSYVNIPRWFYGFRHSQIDTYLKKFNYPYIESFDNSVSSFNDGVKEIIDNQNQIAQDIINSQNQTTQDIINNQNENTNTIINTITNSDISQEEFEEFIDTSVSDNILNDTNFMESENLLFTVWNNFISSINPNSRAISYTANFPLPFVDKNFSLNSDLISKYVENTPLFYLIQCFWIFIFGWHILNLVIRIITYFASGEIIQDNGVASFRETLKYNINKISPFQM